MKVQISGYFDRNLGDDLMIAQALEKIDGAYLEGGSIKPDVRLTVAGSCFLVPDNKALMYRIREVYFDKCARAYIGCNISPFINPLAERVIKRQLMGARLITVRDSFSYDYIKNNIKNARVELFPDMVFASNTPKLTPKGALGITAYGGAGITNAKKFARIADRYIKETGRRVILFAFDTGRENDLLAAREIYGLCSYKDMVEICAYSSDAGSVLSKMADCEKMIAVRHHGTVLALKMGIGVVPVIYSPKTSNMLFDLGFCDRIFDFFSFDEAEVFQSLWNTKYKLDKTVPQKAKGHIEVFLSEITVP